jgi:hypothetical protein
MPFGVLVQTLALARDAPFMFHMQPAQALLGCMASTVSIASHILDGSELLSSFLSGKPVTFVMQMETQRIWSIRFRCVVGRFD